MATKEATGMTPRETQVWKFMLRFQDRHHGMGPSLQEIADYCGLRTRTSIANHLARLVMKGTVMHRNRRYVALRDAVPKTVPSVRELRQRKVR